MSKSKPSKTKLAASLRALGKELIDFVCQCRDSKLLELLPVLIKWVATFFALFKVLCPHKKEANAQTVLLLLEFLGKLPDILEKLADFGELAIKGADRLAPVNSSNSSTPPSKDPNREKTSKKGKGKRKIGGQDGHPGTTLKRVENPDKRIELKVDQSKLGPGDWKPANPVVRQVIDIEVARVVIDYVAEVLVNEKGEKHVAEFPEGVSAPVQYSPNVQAMGVYLNNSQLIPFQRAADLFKNLLGIDISEGTLANFRSEAAKSLSAFNSWAIDKLIDAHVLNVDETGVNIDGKGKWLHNVSSDDAVLGMVHDKRGFDAMHDMGILEHTSAVLCHDHWVPYFKFTQCLHSLCNAHIVRELKGLIDQLKLKWPERMKDFLLELNESVKEAGGALDLEAQCEAREKYRSILHLACEECPDEPKPPGKKKRGRAPKSKARNLIERLRKFEDEVLRFMTDKAVPYSNNRAENDIRMLKVHQKISGCFKSIETANQFCLIRSYLLTCARHDMGPFEALQILFNGRLPDFINLEANDVEQSELAA
jgi:transposase